MFVLWINEISFDDTLNFFEKWIPLIVGSVSAAIYKCVILPQVFEPLYAIINPKYSIEHQTLINNWTILKDNRWEMINELESMGYNTTVDAMEVWWRTMHHFNDGKHFNFRELNLRRQIVLDGNEMYTIRENLAELEKKKISYYKKLDWLGVGGVLLVSGLVYYLQNHFGLTTL